MMSDVGLQDPTPFFAHSSATHFFRGKITVKKLRFLPPAEFQRYAQKEKPACINLESTK